MLRRQWEARRALLPSAPAPDPQEELEERRRAWLVAFVAKRAEFEACYIGCRRLNFEDRRSQQAEEMQRRYAAEPKAAEQRAAAPVDLLLPWWKRRGQWSTEGQCEGMTRLLTRCKVHMSSAHADAEPLRRGERFCVHHDPKKYTGVRCAGMRKKAGRGRCNVEWLPNRGSPSLLLASPRAVRRGYAHGARCNVTSSSLHMHAHPLWNGEKYCAHHLFTLTYLPTYLPNTAMAERDLDTVTHVTRLENRM